LFTEPHLVISQRGWIPAARADVAELVDATDLSNLSAPGETLDVEPLKFGEG